MSYNAVHPPCLVLLLRLLLLMLLDERLCWGTAHPRHLAFNARKERITLLGVIQWKLTVNPKLPFALLALQSSALWLCL